MPTWIVQLMAIAKKELTQTFRDPRLGALLVVAPVLQLTLLGFAVDLDVDRIPTVVCDRDRSPASRELLRGLLAEGTFKPLGEVDDPVAALQRGDAAVAFVLPRGLGRDLARGKPGTQVQVLVDGSDPLLSGVAVATAQQVIERESMRRAAAFLRAQAALRQQVPTMPRLRLEPRIYYNPRLKSPIYMVPGVAATVLLIVTTLITAMSIARERELGTIEQLMVTPLRPAILLVGKVLPFALIGMVVAGVVITVGSHLFSVPLRGSIAVLAAGTALYLLSTLGTGVFISTLAKNQQQAILGAFFFLMPAILLSGFMSPIANMPDWAQLLTYANPVRYYVEILRGCMLKGAGFADLATQLAALAAFGVSILGVSALRFKKRLA